MKGTGEIVFGGFPRKSFLHPSTGLSKSKITRSTKQKPKRKRKERGVPSLREKDGKLLVTESRCMDKRSGTAVVLATSRIPEKFRINAFVRIRN